MDRKSNLKGMVKTVLGLIKAEDLGFTLPHEHLLARGSCYFIEPDSCSDYELAHQPVSIENLSWVRHNPYSSRDNLDFLDERLAIEELMRFKVSGGKTLVDMTNNGIGRDPKALARISRATGISIIMGSGYYISATQDIMMSKKTEDQLTEELVADITVGAKETGICAGVIGEIGCSWPLRDNERKCLRAAARAQQRTGLAINIHPSRNENGPLEVIDILQEAGSQLNRVVISHMDRCSYLLENRLKMLKAGCYIEYDLFGWEGYYAAKVALADGHLPDLPNDVGRIKEIAELIEKGYLRQILISHDISQKIQHYHWGGPGFAHILENVIPLMQVYGYTEKIIHTITVENPKNMLAIQ